MVSWLMTTKAVLISSCVASVALFLKVSVPAAVDFSVSRAPIMWSSLLSWLKPPYLYFITNGIIITIVASSKYYRSTSQHDQEEDDGIVYGGGGGDYKIQTEPVVHDQASPRMLVVKDLDPDSQFGFVAATPHVEDLVELEPEAVTAVVYDEAEEEIIADPVEMVEDENEIEEEFKSVIMAESSDLVESGGDEEVILPPTPISNWNNLPPRMTESENLPPTEKPLVSSRFGHRKSVKANTEGGRALRVTKPKRNETLENTWKMITEGKSTPLTRQLYRRSDTFSRGDSGGSGEAKPVYKKSETFRDRTNYYQQSQEETATAKGKMRKEPSLSQDELNRRVEAFINKFNEEMKLQRMESLRQYKVITSRGV